MSIPEPFNGTLWGGLAHPPTSGLRVGVRSMGRLGAVAEVGAVGVGRACPFPSGSDVLIFNILSVSV